MNTYVILRLFEIQSSGQITTDCKMYISKTDTRTAFYNHSKVYFFPQTGDVLQYINVSVVIEQTHVSPTGTRRRFLMSDNCFTDRQQTSSMTPHAR